MGIKREVPFFVSLTSKVVLLQGIINFGHKILFVKGNFKLVINIAVASAPQLGGAVEAFANTAF